MHTLTIALATVLLTSPVYSPSNRERWPSPTASGFSIQRLFDLPRGEYQAGHRGIDIRASQGDEVRAPTSGTVHFAGDVVDRGVLTIERADHTLVSFEPVSASVLVGDQIQVNDLLGSVSGASHCGTSCLHVGVRVDNHYVNPLRYFFAGRPQLLPLNRESALS